MQKYYIGQISGTSVDSIDTCLIELNDNYNKLSIIDALSYDIPIVLRQNTRGFLTAQNHHLNDALTLDYQFGHLFADAANMLIKKHPNLPITAIGCHGQTIRHQPNGEFPFSLQIGNGAIISQLTRVDTVTNFRNQDIALQGQGAPLAPLFHRQFFASNEFNRCIVNIGGISNISYLSTNLSHSNGFDCGPGNTLMDAWINRFDANLFYDNKGQWARSGKIIQNLLETLLNDSYILKRPPKSTGPEYFNLKWLKPKLNNEYKAQDVQATLLEFTASSIVSNIQQYCPDNEEIYICGGGAFNDYLLQRIAQISQIKTQTTKALNLDPNWIEAALFAWLSAKAVNQQKVDLTPITGSESPATAGCIWYA